MQLTDHDILMNAISPFGVTLGHAGTILDVIDGRHL